MNMNPIRAPTSKRIQKVAQTRRERSSQWIWGPYTEKKIRRGYVETGEWGKCALLTDRASTTGGCKNKLGDRSLPCAGIYGNKTANCVASESLTLRKNLSSVMSPVEVTIDISSRLGVMKMKTYRRKRRC